MAVSVSKEVAERYVDYYDQFCDGENPEEIRYEVAKNANGTYSVRQYYWNVKQQRRIYEGFVNIPEKFMHPIYQEFPKFV